MELDSTTRIHRKTLKEAVSKKKPLYEAQQHRTTVWFDRLKRSRLKKLSADLEITMNDLVGIGVDLLFEMPLEKIQERMGNNAN